MRKWFLLAAKQNRTPEENKLLADFKWSEPERKPFKEKDPRKGARKNDYLGVDGRLVRRAEYVVNPNYGV